MHPSCATRQSKACFFVAIVALGASAACSSRRIDPGPWPEPEPTITASSTAKPAATTDADVRPGEERHEGIYGAEHDPHQRFEGTFVTLDGGERLILGYSPDPEHESWIGKRVVVIGTPYQPEGRAVSGPHLRARIMKLAAP